MSWKEMVLQCFSKLSLSGEIFTGKGGSRQPKLHLYWEALQKKKINNPTVGPDYFVLQKPPSSQKCLNNFVDDC